MSNNAEPSERGAATPPKLFNQVRDRLRVKHYSLRTEQVYVDWIKRFIHVSWQAPPEGHGRAGNYSDPDLTLPWTSMSPPRSKNQALAALVRPCTAQALPGHSDVKTSMIYTYVLQRGGCGVRSPLDRME